MLSCGLLWFAEHDLSELAQDVDLIDTPFARAMNISRGTISVLDDYGITWDRLWWSVHALFHMFVVALSQIFS